MDVNRAFADFASRTARLSGTPTTFGLCVIVILLWAVTGPIFDFSETWQLVINTATTIVTFLMVFIIQNTQNRDGKAIQTKLDELILTSDAEDRFIGIERLTDKELEMLQARCARAAKSHERMARRAAAEMSSRAPRRPAKPRRPARAG